MTPLLILVVGTKPVVAVGTDLAYAAVTKTVGGWRHFRKGTVFPRMAFWLAVGSCPGALLGVWLLDRLRDSWGEDFDTFMLVSIGAALLLGALLAPALGACDTPTAARDETIAAPERPALATVPAKGAANTLDVASWNIEWFGSTGSGPTNETLQASNAKDVILGTDFDIWGVAEIADQAAWNSLESSLAGYTGFLAGESIVTNGSTYYSSTEQKVGILYKSSLATLVGARIILTANDADFAGRPPLEVKLNVTLNGLKPMVM
jgi:hypothetical protein